MRRRALAQAAVGAVATVLVFTALGLTVDLDGSGVALTQQPAAGGSALAAPTAGPWKQGNGLEDLRCFRCHNIERYRHGEDFSHVDHEDAGHCHVCHAFEGHFQATIRRDACEACH